MKNITMGILAHVDAGKTTLSESILYKSGSIRKLGRVDNQDAFLDTNTMERERGITIFSKQARFELGEYAVTLLDTPGHVDFSAEMERTLQVLDYAILVISAADGVQGHTQTLWQLLKRYQIPTFLFINKMDQTGADREAVLSKLQEKLSDCCLDFSQSDGDTFLENVAMCDEGAMEEFLETGTILQEELAKLVKARKVFPCCFGSALKVTGVEEFLQELTKLLICPERGVEFGAKVFKITRDEQGNRLTHLKVTGGVLRVKAILGEEKINQIRLYHGEHFDTVSEVEAGVICAVTGLNETKAGQGLGVEEATEAPVLEPVLTYQVVLPDEVDAKKVLPKLRQLEEEEPELHLTWNEELQEIQAQLMGEVQIEILRRLIKERFDVDVSFGAGKIVYQETIANTVEGVGHFEPLRHYAEVHLILSPGELGSGMQFDSVCREDELDKNWQRLILTHLEEKEHRGVLIGAPITDMHITLAGGKAHTKHTEGGDFRQATYRAIRQGLMQAENILLEPYYSFVLEIPETSVGRAMTDIERMKGSFLAPEVTGGMAILTGKAPVVTMRDYAKEVTAYAKGHGHLTCMFSGYEPCHNTEEVLGASSYDPEADVENPTGSVFCAHGAGFIVPWNQVPDYMHVESCMEKEADGAEQKEEFAPRTAYPVGEAREECWIDTEEIDQILNRTAYANRRDKDVPRKGIPGRHKAKKEAYTGARTISAGQTTVQSRAKKRPDKTYLLVDGYNIIFAWKELKELAAVNIDSARGRLMDILSNYQGMKKCELILVFDAYRVQGHVTETLDYHNIHVVYTKEAETADQYIEKFAHEHGRNDQVTVATSDGLEQIIIRGQGCLLLSARELEIEVLEEEKRLREEHMENRPSGKRYLLDDVSEKIAVELNLTK